MDGIGTNYFFSRNCFELRTGFVACSLVIIIWFYEHTFLKLRCYCTCSSIGSFLIFLRELQNKLSYFLVRLFPLEKCSLRPSAWYKDIKLLQRESALYKFSVWNLQHPSLSMMSCCLAQSCISCPQLQNKATLPSRAIWEQVLLLKGALWTAKMLLGWELNLTVKQ